MDRQVWGLLRVFAPCAKRVAGHSRCSCAVQAAAVILAASSLRALGEMNKGDQVMKNFTKAALGALLVAGATVGTIAATTAPAEARGRRRFPGAGQQVSQGRLRSKGAGVSPPYQV